MITAFACRGCNACHRLPDRELSMPISTAPIARKAPGPDPYAWLQERDNPEVLDYLKAENAWQEAQLADQQALRETLFEEIITPDLIGEIYGPIIAEYSEEELDHIVALVQNPMFNRLSVDLQLKASGSPVMQEKMMAIGMRLVNMVEEVLTEFDAQEQAKAKAERAAPAGMLEA